MVRPPLYCLGNAVANYKPVVTVIFVINIGLVYFITHVKDKHSTMVQFEMLLDLWH